MNAIAATLIFIQLIAIIVHGFILVQYRKYCKHCDWWSDFGCLIFFIFTFFPIVGIIECMVGPLDYMRNVNEAVKEKY